MGVIRGVAYDTYFVVLDEACTDGLLPVEYSTRYITYSESGKMMLVDNIANATRFEDASNAGWIAGRYAREHGNKTGVVVAAVTATLAFEYDSVITTGEV